MLKTNMRIGGKLTVKDKIQIKHFTIYLKLRNKYGDRQLLGRRFWRRYLGYPKLGDEI